MTREMLVSAVIPTKFSDLKSSKALLRDLASQTYQQIEVVIVVKEPLKTDISVLRDEYGGFELPRVTVLKARTGRAAARNLGVEESQGDVILSLDSDMRMPAPLVEDCVEAIASGLEAIIVPEISIGESYWAMCKALEKRCYEGTDVEAARVFRRRVWDAIGGYDSRLEFGEDWDFHQRILSLGLPVGRIHTSIQHDEGELRLVHDLRKKYQYGRSFWLYRKEHPGDALKRISPTRIAFIGSWTKLMTDFPHALGLIVMKSLELLAGGLGHLFRNSKHIG